MVSKELQDIFLQLVRFGIGTETVSRSWFQVSDSTDWVELKAVADEQGLTAIVLDGLDKCYTDTTESTEMLPLQMKLEWIGEVLQNYEQRYKAYENAIGLLAGWYNQHGFKMMLLKGCACSLEWPRPDHRPTGDIDIWQFGEQKAADKCLTESTEIDNSHHHHTVFNWKGFTVENHYDFINVHHHRSHTGFEKILKELGQDGSHSIELGGEKVYLPSPNLHALFLLKHAALHFVGTELTFRQILDWAFFVQKHGVEVDWKMLLPIIEEHGMMPFLNIINAICVGELGFDARIFPTVQFHPEQKDRVVDEIFASVYDGDKDKNLLRRSINRYRRWKGNAWKHDLCYKESMWSAFWSGVWSHLMKPSSI